MSEIITALGSAISNTEADRIKLDRSIKNVLSYKPMLARVFKEAIIINISKNHDTKDSESYIIKLLTDLFDERVDGKQKVIDLKKNYGLPTTVEFEEEVQDMTAYTASIEQKGISKGFSQGLSQGLSQGMDHGIKSLVTTVKKLKGTKQDAISGVVDEYNKPETEAKELVEKYW